MGTKAAPTLKALSLGCGTPLGPAGLLASPGRPRPLCESGVLLASLNSQPCRSSVSIGGYGYCEETGEPIWLKRLEARPIATLSVEAQERHEKREKVYRDG